MKLDIYLKSNVRTISKVRLKNGEIAYLVTGESNKGLTKIPNVYELDGNPVNFIEVADYNFIEIVNSNITKLNAVIRKHYEYIVSQLADSAILKNNVLHDKVLYEDFKRTFR